MKRKSKILIAAAALILAAAMLWIYAYHHRKSCDNLPPLAKIVQMDEGDVNSVLPGYLVDQLIAVWGPPDTQESNEAIWHMDGIRLIVNNNGRGKVVVCSLEKAGSSGAEVLSPSAP